VSSRVGDRRRFAWAYVDVSTGFHRWECGKKDIYINVTG